MLIIHPLYYFTFIRSRKKKKKKKGHFILSVHDNRLHAYVVEQRTKKFVFLLFEALLYIFCVQEDDDHKAARNLKSKFYVHVYSLLFGRKRINFDAVKC